jgi:hypothetical protein
VPRVAPWLHQTSVTVRLVGAYVVLNPDGTQEIGVVALVASPTGVTCGHQCAGHATETRTVEATRRGRRLGSVCGPAGGAVDAGQQGVQLERLE